MPLNENYTFPELGYGKYGTEDFVWNFKTHWPELTQDYIEDLTGYDLANKAGSDYKAQQQIKTVSRLSKSFLFKKLKRDTQQTLTYFVAKDTDFLNEALLYQIEIFMAGFVDGGWISMYETTDEYGIKSSIGKAAEDFLDSSILTIAQYSYYLKPELINVGY